MPEIARISTSPVVAGHVRSAFRSITVSLLVASRGRVPAACEESCRHVRWRPHAPSGIASQGAARRPRPGFPRSRTTAQTPAPSLAPPPVVAGWNEGFFIQTPNGDNRLQIGFVVQADGRFSLDDPLPITNTFVMRKVRPTFTGRVAKYIDFKVMPELAGSVVLLDGYFDIRFSPKLRLRSGKDKTPVGYELLIGDASLIFPERSVVSLLVPNRDVGFQAQGDLAGGKLLYSAGIFNGNPPMAPAPSRTWTRTTARTSPGASSGCRSDRRRRRRTR